MHMCVIWLMEKVEWSSCCFEHCAGKHTKSGSKILVPLWSNLCLKRVHFMPQVLCSQSVFIFTSDLPFPPSSARPCPNTWAWFPLCQFPPVPQKRPSWSCPSSSSNQTGVQLLVWGALSHELAPLFPKFQTFFFLWWFFSFLMWLWEGNRKARGLQTEEIGCKCQTFLSLS